MIDPELSVALDSIKTDHHLNNLEISWGSLVPKIVARILEIAAIQSTGHSTSHSITTSEVAVTLQIQEAKTNVISKLTRRFSTCPPFTVVRLAEILSAPKESGYPLTNELLILKFFNALSRLICVSSTVGEYPRATFQDKPLRVVAGPGSEVNGEEIVINRIGQNAASTDLHIHMVEIPWLKKKDAANSDDDDAVEDDIDDDGSPTSKRSPTRRRRDSNGEDESIKRPRTGTPDEDQMDISAIEDDSKDKMDISTDSILEESDRSEVLST